MEFSVGLLFGYIGLGLAWLDKILNAMATYLLVLRSFLLRDMMSDLLL